MIPTIEKFVSDVVNKYIVRPTGSPNLIGIGGFMFDVLDNEEVSLDAEITDHYVEDNYSIQDHIAIRPLTFTLRGYMAELKDLRSQSLLPVLQNIQSLASIGGFMPEFATQATRAYSKITDVTSKIDSVINQANNVFDIFQSKSTTANNQQAAFKFFKNLFMSRQLCQVETPFEIFDSMAIVSVRALQRGDTKIISDFAVTFKQIRTTATETKLLSAPLLSGRAGAATSEFVSNGQTTGKFVDLGTINVFYQGANQ